MKLFRTMTVAVCGASIAFGPSMAWATSGVDGTTSGMTSTAPAVNSSGNSAGNKNSSAQAFNAMASATELAMAAEKWGECSSDNPGACAMAAMYTAMGIMSMKQAKEDGKKAGQAFTTADLSNAYGTGDYSTTGAGTDTNYGSGTTSSYMQKAQAGLSNLQAKGIVDSTASKITSPDGTTYKASDLANPSSAAAAGVPKGAIDSAMATAAGIEKKITEKLKIGAVTAANGYNEGGGGGGSGRSPSNDDPSSQYAGYGAGMRRGSLLDKDPSHLAAGMSKNYNGEPIGVAADSIFLMMSRRYKVKESQDSFFGITDVDLKK